MKKFLSLVLALVMAMSLVTVSAGAKDFNDSDKISDVAYEEAVNVMSEMGIIDGYGDGNFQPQGTLTRGAAAKIIACMMLGKTTAEALGTQAAPFKDVPVGSTFAGYIAYCSESGIIDGYSDGTFRPGNTLTGFAFLKMLLTALGYDSDIEGYANNANWTVNVAGRAKQIGLLDGNDNFVGTRAATREEACLYAVNALQATLVEYSDKGGSISVGDITINTGASNATYVTSNVYDAATSIDDTWDNTTHDYTVEFAEKYQPDLRLSREVDAFGRPSHTWTWKRVEIGSYIDQDKLVAEYTAKVTGRDLYDLLGSYVVDHDDFVVTIDGVDDVRRNPNVFSEDNILKSNTKAVGATGNGVLTQVFRDSADGVTYIAIINTYLAEATDDFDEDDDVLEVEVYGYRTATARKDTTITEVSQNKFECVSSKIDADNENVPVADYEDGDIMMVRIADGEILEVMDPEVLSSVAVTAFSLTKDTVTSGGTVYDKADTRLYDLGVLDDVDNYTGQTQRLKDLTFNIFLDPYGYFIGIERNEDPDQYVFITGYEEYTKNLTTAIADAGAIFVDGSMKNIEVEVEKDLNWNPNGNPVENNWYTYTTDKDGVYSLTLVEIATDEKPAGEVAQFAWSYTTDDGNGNLVDKDIDKSHISLPAWSVNNDSATLMPNEYGDTNTNQGEDHDDVRVVYGNNDTVYLTVGTDVLTNTSVTYDNSHSARIIDSVKSVTTGVKNANLKVSAFEFGTNDLSDDVNVEAVRLNASAGVYTLYNDDGYIIAAIVVGEDAAASTNYFFATSSQPSIEEDLGEDADSRWTREGIINGAETSLVYVGEKVKYIDKTSMVKGNVYKVSYNANGEVIDSELVVDANANGTLANVYAMNGQVTTNIDDLEKSDDIVLVVVDLNAGNNKLHTKGDTLFTTQVATNGIHFAEDAKAVLVENVNDKLYDAVTYFDKSSGNVKDAVDALYESETQNNNAPFNGVVYAVIEDGLATSIIIVDNNSRPGVNQGTTPGMNQISNGKITLEVTKGNVADSVSVSNAGILRYTFTTPAVDGKTLFDYDYVVYVEGVKIGSGKVTGATAGEAVSGRIDISEDYTDGDKVQIYITVDAAYAPAEPTMTYQVKFVLQSGAEVGVSAVQTVEKSDLAAGATSFEVKASAALGLPEGFKVYGDDTRTVTFKDGAFETVSFVVVEDVPTVVEKMNIVVNYVLTSGGKPVHTEGPTEVSKTDSYVKVVANENALAEKNYVLNDSDSKYVTFVADSIETVEFIVERATAELVLPADVTAEWDADASKGIAAGSAAENTTTEVPVGAQVTLTGITGNYGKGGKELVDDEFTMTADGLKITEDDFGYYEVTLADEVTISNTEISNKIDVEVALAARTFVKGTDVIGVTLTVTEKAGALSNARNISVTGGSIVDENGDGTTVTVKGAETKTVYVKVSGLDNDVELTFSVAD